MRHSEMGVDFVTGGGLNLRLNMKAGAVQRTRVAASRLTEAGYDVILNKRKPRLVNQKSRREILAVRKEGMFVKNLWLRNETLFL